MASASSQAVGNTSKTSVSSADVNHIGCAFFDYGVSVRKLHDRRRDEAISEHGIEDILRQYHRSAVARAANIGRLRAA